MKLIPKKRKLHVEMLALMDMIFLLLVTFIFMIVQMRPNFGIEVTLPKIGKKSIAKQNKKKEHPPIIISVTANNHIFVNKQHTKISQLSQIIKITLNNTPPTQANIILRGDTTADYGKMIKIFTTLKQMGITNILFDVEKNKKEKSNV